MADKMQSILEVMMAERGTKRKGEKKKDESPAPKRVARETRARKKKDPAVGLCGVLMRAIVLHDIKRVDYLPEIYFHSLIGKPPYTLPLKWPKDGVVTISSGQFGRKQAPQSVVFKATSFLTKPHDCGHFAVFLLSTAHATGNKAFRMTGKFRSKFVFEAPHTAMEHVLRATCFIY